MLNLLSVSRVISSPTPHEILFTRVKSFLRSGSAAKALEMQNGLTKKNKKLYIPEDILSKWTRHQFKHGIINSYSDLNSIKNKDYVIGYNEARRYIVNAIHDFSKYTNKQKQEFIDNYTKKLEEYPLLKKEAIVKQNPIVVLKRKLKKSMENVPLPIGLDLIVQKERAKLNEMAGKWRPALEEIGINRDYLKNANKIDILGKYEEQLKTYKERRDVLKNEIYAFSKSLNRHDVLKEEFGDYLKDRKDELKKVEKGIESIEKFLNENKENVHVIDNREGQAENIMLNFGLLDKLEKEQGVISKIVKKIKSGELSKNIKDAKKPPVIPTRKSSLQASKNKKTVENRRKSMSDIGSAREDIDDVKESKQYNKGKANKTKANGKTKGANSVTITKKKEKNSLERRNSSMLKK